MMTYTFLMIEGIPASYSNKYEDFSRPGSNGMLFLYTGKRGDKTKLTGIIKGENENVANYLFSLLLDQVGTELYIRDYLQNHTWQVFLHSADMDKSYAIAGLPVANGDNWRIEVELQVTRTA